MGRRFIDSESLAGLAVSIGGVSLDLQACVIVAAAVETFSRAGVLPQMELSVEDGVLYLDGFAIGRSLRDCVKSIEAMMMHYRGCGQVARATPYYKVIKPVLDHVSYTEDKGGGDVPTNALFSYQGGKLHLSIYDDSSLLQVIELQ